MPFSALHKLYTLIHAADRLSLIFQFILEIYITTVVLVLVHVTTLIDNNILYTSKIFLVENTLNTFMYAVETTYFAFFTVDNYCNNGVPTCNT